MKTIAAEIRYARMQDADALADAHEAAWRGAYAGLIPHRPLNAMIARRRPAWWSRAIGSGAGILTLDHGGTIAGYATLGRNRTRALRGQGEIYELYLRPQFQGIGFGRTLFDAARAELAARHMDGLVVWALEDNDRATAFYAAMGGADVAAGSETFDGVILPKVAFLWS